ASNNFVVDAQRIMTENNLHSLPVVDKDRLVGMIAQNKILRITGHPGIYINPIDFMDFLTELRVEHVMDTEIVTISPDTTLESAVQLVQRHDIDSLPVVAEDKQLIGIVISMELYKGFIQALKLGNKPG
ncbi:MAG: CBS domain-containing protein, partial [Thermodesulfobacteriota bacterium]|nr:CBS domain-containing protein [Thermodesulfobacteriota bacterium]